MVNFTLLAVAVILLLCAHILRAARWSLLFPKGSAIPSFSTLFWLSAGYVVNAFVPFRIGELLRIFMVSREEKVRPAYVAATVALERVSDLAVVGVLFLALLAFDRAPAFLSLGDAAVLIALMSIGIGLGIWIKKSLRLRRALWAFAGIFNARIGHAISDFFWVYSDMILGRVALRLPFLALTVAMWAVYFAAYAVFARSLGQDFIATAVGILRDPMGSFLERLGTELPGDARALYLFIGLPLALVLAIGLFRRWARLGRLITTLRVLGAPTGPSLDHQQHFLTPDIYNRYIADQFGNADALATSFWREALGNCTVHRFFRGGSDAITALIEVDDVLLIRKFALGEAGAKLRVQADWLTAQQSADLPLVAVRSLFHDGEMTRYDMDYVAGAVDLYDVLHTRRIAATSGLFGDLLARVDRFHRATAKGAANDDTVRDYLAQKAVENARKILDFVTQEFTSDRLTINGRVLPMDRFRRLLDLDWLVRQVSSRQTCDIHGDLTIENVIVAPETPAGFYLIDPNPENTFNSPLIDWAKLMQSLNLGYETLNRGLDCTISANAIDVHATRSHTYAQFHETLLHEFTQRYGAAALGELHLHELVNYLRLTSYKIRQDTTRGLGFFACTFLLLDDYLETWAKP